MISQKETSYARFLPTQITVAGGFVLTGVCAVFILCLRKENLFFFDFSLLEYLARISGPETLLHVGKLLNGSSVVSTGVGIVGTAAFIAAVHQLWDQFWTLYHSYFSVSLEISSTDGSYLEVLDWVHGKQLKNPKHLSTKTQFRPTYNDQLKAASNHDFIPGPGIHKFKFEGQAFKINRKRAGTIFYEEDGDYVRLETLRVSVSASNTQVFRDMLSDVKQYFTAKTSGETCFYKYNRRVWEPFRKRKRPMDSVFLGAGIAESITADIADFIDSSEWYAKFGVPYRRSYLLHGPSGTGKTSFVTALAGLFDMDIAILDLCDRRLTDFRLNRLLNEAPKNSIILLENVDVAFGSREEKKPAVEGEQPVPAVDTAKTRKSLLTFGGLLNAIDGVGVLEGRILFMTTNHLEKLDAALIRPGRVDVRQHIGYASESQVERIFRRFYCNATEAEVRRFVGEIFNGSGTPKISMAEIQNLFLRFKSCPSEITAAVSDSCTKNY